MLTSPVSRRAGVPASFVCAEALLVLRRRPVRFLLSTIGAVLGVGILSATVALTTSAESAVAERFNELRPRQLRIDADSQIPWVRSAALSGLRDYPGVDAAGVVRAGEQPVMVSRHPGDWSQRLPTTAMAADPEALRAMDLQVVAGRSYDIGHIARGDRVALMGEQLAESLGLNLEFGRNVVFVDETPLRVVGTVSTSDPASAEALLSILVPSPRTLSTTANVQRFGPEEVVVHVREGAMAAVAQAAPLLLRPEAVDSLVVKLPPEPQRLRTAITSDVRNLLLALGAITVAVGTLAIGNTTLMAVIERRSDIGLRRALGAGRLATVGQVISEAMLTGCTGGLIGAAIGQGSALAIASARGWPLTIWAAAIPLGAVAGALIGAVAGCYPAAKAAAVQPVEALRA